MSRLIDADELLKDAYFMDETIPERMMFIEAVENSPTAYSAEAVVKELEELHIRNSKGVLVAEVYNNAINDAIAIVKRGGRND